MVPEPNAWVWPVTVFPFLPRSVVSEPDPKGRVSVVEPSDHLVIVPEPNFCVCPVIVRPSRPRSVVMEPEPKGRVWLLVPSDLWVSVPEPNFWVCPVRGWLRVARGGDGSAAAPWTHGSATTSMDRMSGMQAGIVTAHGSGGGGLPALPQMIPCRRDREQVDRRASARVHPGADATRGDSFSKRWSIPRPPAGNAFLRCHGERARVARAHVGCLRASRGARITSRPLRGATGN